MSAREIVAKILAFGLVAAGLVVGGILVLVGPHTAADGFNTFIGWTLIVIGVACAGFGVFSIATIRYAEKLEREAHAVHLTPRNGPPAAPPAWGMGDIGRPGHGIVEVGREGRMGGGSVRLVAVRASKIDGPIFVTALLIWTAIGLLLLAPK